MNNFSTKKMGVVIGDKACETDLQMKLAVDHNQSTKGKGA